MNAGVLIETVDIRILLRSFVRKTVPGLRVQWRVWPGLKPAITRTRMLDHEACHPHANADAKINSDKHGLVALRGSEVPEPCEAETPRK